MVTLQLTSHYLELHINIRMEAIKACRLLNSTDPMDEINKDIARISYGSTPFYLTPSQGRRIKNFFSSENKDFFDNVEML